MIEKQIDLLTSCGRGKEEKQKNSQEEERLGKNEGVFYRFTRHFGIQKSLEYLEHVLLSTYHLSSMDTKV